MGFARKEEKRLLKQDAQSLGQDVLSRTEREAYGREQAQGAAAQGRSLYSDVARRVLGSGGGASALVQGQGGEALQQINRQTGEVAARGRKEALDLNRQLVEARRQEFLARLAQRGAADWKRTKYWTQPVQTFANNAAGSAGRAVGTAVGTAAV